MDTNKSTDELLKILQKEDKIENYIEKNKDDLFDITLANYLDNMLTKYNVKKSDVINNAKLPTSYTYDIFNGKKVKPNRNILIQLIFGMGLNLEDAQRLLKLAGVSELYTRIKRDSVIIFAIEKGKSISECDDLLYELNEETIIKA